ncbi:CdaR family protein [Lactobacillaceae bacterium L1_55_11]|nr:CdaR family protein [Lactobacillaceae bacterium L1_55_11]
MKNWTNSKVINLVFSLFLALLLSAYVLSTQSSSRNNKDEFTSILPEKRANLTVALGLQYDSDQYVVVGAPASVNISVHGPAAIVTATQGHNDIQAVADLRDLGVGQHSVKVAVKGVNTSLTSTVNPQTVQVTIAKKTSEKRNIKVTYDDSKLASGYSVGSVSASPKSIGISGPKANVDSVAYIAAAVDLPNNTKSTVTQNVKLVALDSNGEPVEVKLSQQTADATVTVNNEPSKKLNLSATVSGGDSSNFDIAFSPKTVTAYGSSDTLNGIDHIDVPVDVSDVSRQKVSQVKLSKPNGVDSLSDDSVQVTVTPH